jgi:hypothetical protein
MENVYLKRRKSLSPVATIMLIGLVFTLYKIFKSPELDKEIDKFIAKEVKK